MNVSFDGLRKNLARSFNEMCRAYTYNHSEDSFVVESMKELRGMIGGLLACYDPDKQPNDFNMLADDVTLFTFDDEDDDE